MRVWTVPGVTVPGIHLSEYERVAPCHFALLPARIHHRRILQEG